MLLTYRVVCRQMQTMLVLTGTVSLVAVWMKDVALAEVVVKIGMANLAAVWTVVAAPVKCAEPVMYHMADTVEHFAAAMQQRNIGTAITVQHVRKDAHVTEQITAVLTALARVVPVGMELKQFVVKPVKCCYKQITEVIIFVVRMELLLQ